MSNYFDESDIRAINGYLSSRDDGFDEEQFITNALEMDFYDAYEKLFNLYTREETIKIMSNNMPLAQVFGFDNWKEAMWCFEDEPKFLEIVKNLKECNDKEQTQKLLNELFEFIIP